MNYSGRLTRSDGSPLEGPVAIQARFWNAPSGGVQIGQTLEYSGINLSAGVFALDLLLNPDQVAAIFDDGSTPVYIEITSDNKIYPRQQFSYVPFALRVPIDSKTLAFDEVGKLSLSLTTKPGANQFLTKDSNGKLIWGTPAAATIQNQTIATGTPNSGQVLTYNGLQWTASNPSQINSGTLNTAQLPQFGSVGTYVKVTTDAYGRISDGATLSASDLPPHSASLVTSGTLDSARLPSIGTAGTYAKVTTDAYGRVSGGTTLASSDVTSSLGFTPLNKAGDTIAGVLNLSSNDVVGAGNIQMAASKTLSLSGNAVDPAGLVTTDKGKTWFNTATKQIKYWDGDSTQVVGVVGASVTSLNNQTGTTQTLAVPGTSGTAPAWSSAANAHTLNIPLASTVSVTAGLISNADYNAFNGKVTGVTSGTGVSVSTTGNISTVALDTTGSSGTYAKVTTDAYGRVSAGTTLLASDLPPHSAALITSGTLNTAQLPTIGTAGTYAKVTTDAYGRVSAGTTLASSDVTSSLGFTPLNKAGDTMTGALNLVSNDVLSAGNIQMAASKTLSLSGNSVDPTGLVTTDKGKTWFNTATKQIKYWDGDSTQVVGAVGSAVTSLNNQTGTTQTLAVPGTSGTAPAWSSAANAHTLNIPLASTASVTAGLISNSDYNTFNGKVTAVSSGTGVSVSTTGTVSTVALDTAGTSGTYAKVTTDAYGRVSAGTTLLASDLPPHSAELITSGTLNTAQLPTIGTAGTYAKVTTDDYGRVSAGTTLASSDITSSLGFTPINKAGDTMSGSLNLGSNDVLSAGNIQMAASKTLSLSGNAVDPAGVVTTDKGKTWFNTATKQIKYWDGDSTQVVGAVGSALTSLNNQTGTTQTLAVPGISGTAPSWSSAANAHTLNIPLASTPSVTAGLLSNSDYNTLNSKVSGVTSGSGVTVSTTGNLATVSLSAAGTAGSYAKVTTDAYGRVTAGTTLSDADIPPLPASLITSGTLNTAQLPTIGTAGTFAKVTTDAYGRVSAGTTLASSDITSSLGFTPINKAGDSITGILSLSANGLVAGTNQLVLANGNVGIGTTAPAALFDIGATTANNTNAILTRGGDVLFQIQATNGNGSNNPGALVGKLGLRYNGVGDSALFNFYRGNTTTDGSIGISTSGSDRVTINSTGNVGIGTSSPSSTFEVAGGAMISTAGADLFSNTLRFQKRGTTGNATAAVASGTELGYQEYYGWDGTAYGRGAWIGSKSEETFTSSGHGANLMFVTTAPGSTTNTERLRITGAGNVGIGTTAPGSILHLNGANPSITLQPTAGGAQSGIQFVTPTNTAGMSIGRDRNSTGTNDMFFYDQVAGATRMYISSTGNVGIGTTLPAAKLHVDGEVKLGSSGSSCATNTEGQVRYNTTLKRLEYCDGMVWQSGGHSAGEVASFAGSTCPNGWLAANGGTALRTNYSSLYNAIGTTYGTGDGSTTFTLPDMRGEFIRGYDNGRGIDSGRTLGSSQISTQILVDDDQYQSAGAIDWANNNLGNLGYETAQVSGINLHYVNPSSGSGAAGSQFARSIRPRNVALLYCIKY